MENKDLVIDLEFLKSTIDFTSSSLVGKLLKRFEILQNKDDIKKSCKELVYEEFRHLRDNLLAYNTGRTVTIWNFKKKEVK